MAFPWQGTSPLILHSYSLMLSIRLSRVGKPKQAQYRVIICEKARDPWGKALEILGTYEPRKKENALNIDRERVAYWLSKGAQCTDTMWNLLLEAHVVNGEKRKTLRLSKKRHASMEAAANEKKAKEAAPAPEAPAEAAPQEAPAA